jgi:hypothetical protein
VITISGVSGHVVFLVGWESFEVITLKELVFGFANRTRKRVFTPLRTIKRLIFLIRRLLLRRSILLLLCPSNAINVLLLFISKWVFIFMSS